MGIVAHLHYCVDKKQPDFYNLARNLYTILMDFQEAE